MLKIFESLDFSDSISITKELPPYQKLVDGLDVNTLIDEMKVFSDLYIEGAPWPTVYGVSVESGTPAYEELKMNGLLGGYNQKQLTQSQIESPWQTWKDNVGTYTKSVFETYLSSFHRPRYVTTKPGWMVRNHTDWDSNLKFGLRCHLILETNDQCKHYVTDDEGIEHELHFAPGEVWFYNIQKLHRAENSGTTKRTSLSFELFNDDLIA
jgi:hypothetical protein